MNFGQITNRVMDATLRGGALEGGNREQIQEDINEAIKWVDALTRPLVRVTTETLIADQGDYSLANDFALQEALSIRDIVYGPVSGQGYQLEETSAALIRERRRTTTSSTFINLYALDGLDLLLLYPTTQSTGDQITIYYSPRPVDLLDDSDVPVGLPMEFHDLYELGAIQRSMRQSSPEYSLHYTQLFDKRLADYRKWRSHHSTTLARRASVGRGNRRYAPHDNSTDWR